ncbi:DMT family transporter [Furfurilactobacillus milii]|uniref:EamA-like transporter family protein n=1 Tax=Furfurilactobacillus milii TaxID=2888272 RepID=A0A6N9I520_9LACO|nr:DMT family transporter [Furfurilactobacillus milii]MYV17526.1 hypothetical protein [Furfurilactobacillus milii]
MEKLLLLFFALIAGSFQPIQSGVNATLRTHINSAYLTGAISNFIGAVIMLLLAASIERNNVSLIKPAADNWWLWTGGILSALIVLSTVIVPGRIGYATFFGLFIAGQLLMSIMIDFFGWFGGHKVTINIQEIFGILLLVGGSWLITRSHS